MKKFAFREQIEGNTPENSTEFFRMLSNKYKIINSYIICHSINAAKKYLLKDNTKALKESLIEHVERAVSCKMPEAGVSESDYYERIFDDFFDKELYKLRIKTCNIEIDDDTTIVCAMDSLLRQYYEKIFASEIDDVVREIENYIKNQKRDLK